MKTTQEIQQVQEHIIMLKWESHKKPNLIFFYPIFFQVYNSLNKIQKLT